jgi:hypothetical protein
MRISIMNEFTLTKQISKQGPQAVIIIPSFLREKLRPKMLVEIKIKILDENINTKGEIDDA